MQVWLSPAETFHNAEHTSPSLGVGNVVGHKVKVLFAHGGSTRGSKSGLDLQQASAAQLVAELRVRYFLT